jgi:hypothetical protein
MSAVGPRLKAWASHQVVGCLGYTCRLTNVAVTAAHVKML